MSSEDNIIPIDEVTADEVLEPNQEIFLKAPSPLIRSFTRHFIEQGFENAAEAARKAGTAAKNPNHMAFQWLQDPWVKREVERAKELLDRGENPLELIREEEVIAKLMSVYEQALSHQKYGPALDAVKLMGQQIGMFREVKDSKALSKGLKEIEQKENIEGLKTLGGLLGKPKELVPVEIPKNEGE